MPGRHPRHRGNHPVDSHYGTADRRPHRTARQLPGPGSVRGLDCADRRRLQARCPDGQQHAAPDPDKHGNLQRNTAALDEVEGILTASSIIIKAAKPVPLRVDAPDFALAGEAITIRVTPAEATRQVIGRAVINETGTPVEARRLRPSGQTITIDGLAPGAYTIDVAGTDLASPLAPVSSDILIWEARR
jgi:hypothetical protein